MDQLYTHGTWKVKRGREDEFIDAWRELAEWTKTQFPDARGTLLRDRADPRRFVSFGPWPSLEAIEEWRAAPRFQESVARLRGLLEAFEPQTLDVVVKSD